MEFVIARSEATKQSRTASRPPQAAWIASLRSQWRRPLSPLRGGKSSAARVRGRCRES